jgi:hypothetical protein
MTIDWVSTRPGVRRWVGGPAGNDGGNGPSARGAVQSRGKSQQVIGSVRVPCSRDRFCTLCCFCDVIDMVCVCVCGWSVVVRGAG